MPFQHTLKTKLQSLGALRPEAWLAIEKCMQQTELKPSQSFIRTEGTLAYVAQGLLKEYDAQNRKSPSIINFMGTGACLMTRKHNQSHYLKASMPTLIYYWDFEHLMQLYSGFTELKSIYNALCCEYDAGLGVRQLLLESSRNEEKIALFIDKYSRLIGFLKKKDIANYLNISYHYFIHLYNERP